MKKFAFFPTTSVNKNLQESILIKYRNQNAFMDLLKISGLFFVFIFSLFVYLRYVSLSSTHGYFLRKENQNLNNVSFKQEIFKTQILDQRKNNREKLNSTKSSKKDVVIVSTQIVTIPANLELSMN